MSYFNATTIIDPDDIFYRRVQISDKDGTPIGVVKVSDCLTIQAVHPDALDKLAATLAAVAEGMRAEKHDAA